MDRKIPWPRVIAEGILIVASILLAFALDAWWDGRSVRAAADEELGRVYDELLADRARIERSFQVQAVKAAGAAELARRIEAAEGPRVIVPDTLLRGLFEVGTFESRAPALDGLLRSGTISLIADADVRAAISVWEQSLRNASELQLRARRLSDEHVLPTLTQRGEVGHIIRSEVSGIGFRAERLEAVLVDAELDPGGATEVSADAALSGAISIRFSTAARASSALGQLLQATDELLQVLEEHRGR